MCIKTKRKSYLIDNGYYGKGLWIPRLDETTSKRTHVAFELPVALYFKNSLGLEMAGGLMGRAWQSTDLNSDILASQQEYGLWGALNQNIAKRMQIGLEIYWGLSRFPTGILIGGPGYTVKNSFLTGNVIYKL